MISCASVLETVTRDVNVNVIMSVVVTEYGLHLASLAAVPEAAVHSVLCVAGHGSKAFHPVRYITL